MMKKNLLLLAIWMVCVPFMIVAQRPPKAENAFFDKEFWAAKPSLEVVKQKIAAGNDPLAMNPMAFNATCYAILNQASFDVVKYLVGLEGNDINTLSHDARTYVHWAAVKGNLEVVKYLVKQGADATIADSHGYTALNFAANAGQSNLELYDFLFANGAKQTDVNSNGANALLLIAPQIKDEKTLDYFLKKGFSLQSKDKDGSGIFYYAAKSGNTVMMDILISRGINPKETNDLGATAMIAAAQGTRRSSNDLAAFKYLESKGLKAKVVSKEGETPLHGVAAKSKDVEVINYFLGKGLKADQLDAEGNNALMLAAGRNDLEVIKLLAGKVKNINTKNEKGQTALTLAVGGNKTEVVSYLIAEGADINVVDAEGNALAFYLLGRYRPNAKADVLAKIAALKTAGYDFKKPFAKGSTLLQEAVVTGDLDLIQNVAALGIDINAANEDGLTALHLAAMKATNDKVLKYLLEAGADKAAKTTFEESAYDLASENEQLSERNVNIDFLKI